MIKLFYFFSIKFYFKLSLLGINYLSFIAYLLFKIILDIVIKAIIHFHLFILKEI